MLEKPINLIFENSDFHEVKKLVLSKWDIDYDFINNILEMSKKYQLISFDIFDTAVTRIFSCPTDVFCELERILVARFGDLFKGFATLREDIESEARQKFHRDFGYEDINIYEIYDYLALVYPKFKNYISEIINLELQIEKEAIMPVPDILELYKQLKSMNKQIMFVSDMYLPQDWLKDLLKDIGFSNLDDDSIIVSSKYRLLKGSGNLWEYIIQKKGDSILHIGDNVHADIKMPEKYGIRTILYNRAASKRRFLPQNNPARLPYSLSYRLLHLISNSNSKNSETFWLNLGRSWGAIVYGAFANFILNKLPEGIEGIYFLSRDGFLPLKVFERVLDKKKNYNLKISYLYVSRKTLTLPTLFFEKQNIPEKLGFYLGGFGRSLSPLKIVESLKFGSDVDIEIEHKARKFFGDLNRKISNEELVNFINKNKDLISQSLHDGILNTIKYLQQEGLTNRSKVAIVDIGWAGNLQTSLASILKYGGYDTIVYGFYIGLWKDVVGKFYKAGPMLSFLANPFKDFQEQKCIGYAVPLLEELAMEYTGSVTGYRLDSITNKYVPIFQELDKHERNQFEKIVLPFQRGVIEALENELFDLDSLDRETALETIRSLLLSPDYEELISLASLKHCSTVDHKDSFPIIFASFPSKRKEIYKVFEYNPWDLGQLKLWWILGDDKKKALLREVINERLSIFGSRVLRQFY